VNKEEGQLGGARALTGERTAKRKEGFENRPLPYKVDREEPGTRFLIPRRAQGGASGGYKGRARTRRLRPATEGLASTSPGKHLAGGLGTNCSPLERERAAARRRRRMTNGAARRPRLRHGRGRAFVPSPAHRSQSQCDQTARRIP
jgi:hypothetical protein